MERAQRIAVLKRRLGLRPDDDLSVPRDEIDDATRSIKNGQQRPHVSSTSSPECGANGIVHAGVNEQSQLGFSSSSSSTMALSPATMPNIFTPQASIVQARDDGLHFGSNGSESLSGGKTFEGGGALADHLQRVRSNFAALRQQYNTLAVQQRSPSPSE